MAATALLAGTLGACTSNGPAAPAALDDDPVAAVSLPDGPLRELVPAPDEVPTGMVPLLTASGSRDAGAIAEFSPDPAAALVSLVEHGFAAAYVTQYADPAGSRVLSVVVARFGSPEGAQADLDVDLAASSGEAVTATTVGDASDVRRQPLPGGNDEPAAAELVTLRFRAGSTTWLLAYGDRPKADPEVAVRLGRLLAGRAS